MENLTLETLINNVEKYNKNAEKSIVKAYELAEYLHRNQLRQSGEPYIIHPLNVAYMLSEIQADCDTLCAALLHDTLEDTDITYKEIKDSFNKEVAKLVDGVTKISRMNFSTKQEQNNANERKIIMSLGKDVRIIFIKLIDRLHNMRTIQYKSEFKQKENSLETLKLYVPVANYVGIYRVKTELEDISFRCLDPYNYQKIEDCLIDKDTPEGVRLNFTKDDRKGWCLIRQSAHDLSIVINIESDVTSGAKKIFKDIEQLKLTTKNNNDNI